MLFGSQGKFFLQLMQVNVVSSFVTAMIVTEWRSVVLPLLCNMDTSSRSSISSADAPKRGKFSSVLPR